MALLRAQADTGKRSTSRRVGGMAFSRVFTEVMPWIQRNGAKRNASLWKEGNV